MKSTSPFTTFCTTRTVEISECLLKALVAYADRDITVCPSSEVQNAMRNILEDWSVGRSSAICCKSHEPNIGHNQRPGRPSHVDGLNLADTFLGLARSRDTARFSLSLILLLQQFLSFKIHDVALVLHRAVRRTRAMVDQWHCRRQHQSYDQRTEFSKCPGGGDIHTAKTGTCPALGFSIHRRAFWIGDRHTTDETGALINSISSGMT